VPKGGKSVFATVEVPGIMPPAGMESEIGSRRIGPGNAALALWKCNELS